MRYAFITTAAACFTTCFMANTYSADFPNAPTKDYLSRLLKKDVDRTDVSKWIARDGMPLETLLMLEVADPVAQEMKIRNKIDGPMVKSIVAIFQYPMGHSYLTPERKEVYSKTPAIVIQEIPIDRPTVILIVSIAYSDKSGECSQKTQVLFAQFQEQPELRSSKVSDQKTCWAVQQRRGDIVEK